MQYHKKVVVIAGPTASGETTFTKELCIAYPNFVRLVGATTRSPRHGEKEGVDYYYMSKERFFDEMDKGNIVEHTHVKNRDAYYGTYKPDLDKKIGDGKVVIANTDLTGSRFFKQAFKATTIFIKPKSIYTIRDRLIRREPEITADQLEQRLTNAMQEIIDSEQQYDYTVWNDDHEFSETIEQVVNILRKEGYDISSTKDVS